MLERQSADQARGELYAFDFVTQDLLAPESVIDPITGRQVNWRKSSYTHAPTCTTTADHADYFILESNRFRTPYVTVKVRPSLELNLEAEQVGFPLLRRLGELQNEAEAFEASDPAPASKLRELQQGESFLEYLIELQTAYGISNFF